MRTPARFIVVAIVVVFLLGGGFGPVRAGWSGKQKVGSRSARVIATNAALHETRGGRVTGTEFEDGRYDVEVVLPDGRQVEVDVDRDMTVIGKHPDHD